jgi:2-beta-glucuronyltransferase
MKRPEDEATMTMDRTTPNPSTASVAGEAGGKTANYLILSAHDYRSPRKANIHFITGELARRGRARFFSLRYSRLSRYTGDPRLSLDDRANFAERHEGVDCYLWKTQFHPINTRKRFLRPAESILFRWYVRAAGATLRQWMAEADVIIFESGIAPIFFDLAKRQNPRAQTIYIASDDLDTINVAEYVKQTFQRVAPAMTTIRLPSKALAKSIPSGSNLCFIPHGIDHALANCAGDSPYGPGTHGVSVGSMLFDPDFFVVASKRFPEIHFHIIGCGQPAGEHYGSNVTVYDEMPHGDTIRYIKHATFGIAPYKAAQVPDYLADTSMKLIQYDFLELPAVCPWAVVGDYDSRIGYTPGDETSIGEAIDQALQMPHRASRRHLNWGDVTNRLLEPQQYEDTRLSEASVKDSPAINELDDPQTLALGGLAVKALTYDGLTELLVKATEQGQQTALFFVNSNLIMKGDALRDQLNGPGVVLVNDGIAMNIASWLVHRRRFPANLNGTDYTPALLVGNARDSDHPWGVYLFGGKPGIAERAAESLRDQRIRVVGTADGYSQDNDELIHSINHSGADVVLVAMGNPLQEQWILENRKHINARLLIGVGALLDFLAGDKPRAPRLIRRMHLEWAYRLSLEPSRLMRRYTLDMFLFLARCVRFRR